MEITVRGHRDMTSTLSGEGLGAWVFKCTPHFWTNCAKRVQREKRRGEKIDKSKKYLRADIIYVCNRGRRRFPSHSINKRAGAGVASHVATNHSSRRSSRSLPVTLDSRPRLPSSPTSPPYELFICVPCEACRLFIDGPAH